MGIGVKKDDNAWTKELSSVLSSINDLADGIEAFYNEIDATVSKQDEKIKDLIPQAIASVGIFVAVITVMFGGFHLVTALNSLDKQPITMVIVLITFIGQMIFNILFLLMFLLSRMAEKTIYNTCRHFEGNAEFKEKNLPIRQSHCRYCEYDKNTRKANKNVKVLYCKHCEYGKDAVEGNKDVRVCGSFKRSFVKFPYIYIANGFFILIYLSILGGYIFKWW